MQRFRWILAAVALLSVGLGPAKADELYTTFGPGDSFNNFAGDIFAGSGSGVYQSTALEFSPSETATVDQVRFAAFVNVAGSVDAVLAADDGGKPGATLEDLGSVTPSGTPAIYSLTSSLHPQVTAGSEYWLILQPTDPNSNLFGGWDISFPEVFGTKGYTNDPAHQSWSVLTGTGVWQDAFDIQGTQVSTPEPATSTLLGLGGLLSLSAGWWRRRRRR
jgi:hypothetical protein